MAKLTLATTDSSQNQQYLFENAILTTVDNLYNRIRITELYEPNPQATCCFMRMAALLALPQMGSHPADLLITVSTITAEFAPTLIRLYEQMPAPKAVVTLGACNTPHRSTFRVVDTLIPVDVHLSECPLRSQTLLSAIAPLRKASIAL